MLSDETMVNVMVRGIYSTALTKLFIDEGFNIVRPSKRISERFGLERNSESWDVLVEGSPRPFGVKIYGYREALEKVLSAATRIGHVVFCRSTIPLGAVYNARVVESRARQSVVDVGEFRGIVPGALEEGTVLKVSTIRPSCQDVPKMYRGVAISGKYAILGKGLQPGVADRIDQRRTNQLLRLATSLSRRGWGVYFIETAKYASPHELIEEVENLYEEIENIDDGDEIGLVRDGLHAAKLNYSFIDKRRLDLLRKSVTPTVLGHHYMRSLGHETAVLVKFAERLVMRGFDWEDIGMEMLRSYVSNEFNIGSFVTIYHYLPDGSYKELTPGKVVELGLDDMTITLHRTIRGEGGFYDGIQARKEAGDYAISRYKLGEMFSETRYYSAEGKLKGVYVNISTPIEFGRRAITYVDLRVDVVKTLDGKVLILDLEELELDVEKGRVPQETAVSALRLAEQIKEKLSSEENLID